MTVQPCCLPASLLLCARLQECSSSCATEGVHVEVTTAYVGAQAQLDPTYEAEEGVPQKQYFTYRIRVSNCRYG